MSRIMITTLARLYAYLSQDETLDDYFLGEVMRTSRSRDVIKNTLELLQNCKPNELRKIDLYPVLKVCFKQSIPLNDFVPLYSILVKSCLPFIEYRTMLLVHEYVKSHPHLHQDDLLLSPFKFKAIKELSPWTDLNYMSPKGHINYLLKSEQKSTVFNSHAMDQVEENETIVRLINILVEYEQIAIAGGYPTALLDHTIEYNPQTDIDVFIYGPGRKQRAKDVIRDIEKEFGPKIYHKHIGSVVTFWVPDTPVRIQIILSRAKNLFSLLNCFDFNYCSWAYMPREDRFVGTFQAFYSLQTRTTFLNGSKLKLERLIKAHYKGYSIVSYQPFEVTNKFPDGSKPEIFNESGLNLKELYAMMPEMEYRFEYYVPKSSLPVEKNLYDLRKYYKDDEIETGPVDLEKLNYYGIKAGYGYPNRKKLKDRYDLADSDDKASLLKILKGVEFTKKQFDNVEYWKTSPYFRVRTAPVMVEVDQYMKKNADRIELNIHLLQQNAEVLKDLVMTVKERFEEHGEKLDVIPVKKDLYCKMKLRNLENLSIKDINGEEVELEDEGRHYAILEFDLGEIYHNSKAFGNALVLPCRSIKYC